MNGIASKMRRNAALELNYRFAGAIIDASKLTAKGWRDLTGACEEGEWMRLGSAWILYTEAVEGCEYQVACALSRTGPGYNEKRYLQKSTIEHIRAAHRGEAPRYCFFRRAQVWTCNEKVLKLEHVDATVPDCVITHARQHLEEALEKPALPFVDDLMSQTEGYEPKGFKGTDYDRPFFALRPVMENEVRQGGTESLARLLTPFTRAMLTDEDAAGREYLKHITQPCIIEWIAYWAERCEFPEACVAAFRLARMLRWRHEVAYVSWLSMAYAAIEVEDYDVAPVVLKYLRSELCLDSNADECFRDDPYLYRAMVKLGNRCPGDAKGFARLVKEYDNYLSAVDENVTARLWVAIAQAYLDTLKGRKVTAAHGKALIAFALRAADQFDKKHEKRIVERPYLKDLPIGVKAPLEWQAFIYASIQRPDAVLRVFPRTVASDEELYPYAPALSPVNGLSPNDIWYGLALPRGYSFDDMVPMGEKQDAQSAKNCLATMNEPGTFQLMEPKEKGASELQMVDVSGESADGKKRALCAFPFLPQEYPGNKANAKVKIWRYHPWQYGEAADAEFETEDGRCYTAVMPWYVADAPYLARGAMCEAVVVGFAYELKKLATPKSPKPITVTEGPLVEEKGHPVEVGFEDTFFDSFEQDLYDPEVSGAGFTLFGRVKSVRRLVAYGVRQLAVEVECARLKQPLTVYIAAEHVKGRLKAGDSVEAYGWLYLDAYRKIDSVNEFKREHPIMAPCAPTEDRFDRMVPTYVRTELTEEERKGPLARMLTPDWGRYGRNALAGCEGVSCVEICPKNPLAIDYLVKKDGQVIPYKLVIVKKGENPCRDYPGMQVLELHLEPAPRGYKLKWEGLPSGS